ncbi:mitochondrial intermembrane space import and assembly protein 40, partial [Caerostris extrusa]
FLLPNGEINWGCPCLGSAAIGPCSVEFRESVSCFHKSEADPKGSDCLQEFRDMNDCMDRYPELFERKEKSDKAALQSLDEEEEKEVVDSVKEQQASNSATVSESVPPTK